MEIRKRVSGDVEGAGKIFGGDVMQAQKDECALNGVRLGLGSLLARFVGWCGGRNNSRLKGFSRRGRKVLFRCEPLIQFGFTGESSSENLTLQFRQFKLLVGDRVAGGESRFGEGNLIVLPVEIAKSKQSVGGELVERPLAFSFEI